MTDQMKEPGKVKSIQVQPSGMIIDTPAGDFYDVTRRVEVHCLVITPLGIEADFINGSIFSTSITSITLTKPAKMTGVLEGVNR